MDREGGRGFFLMSVDAIKALHDELTAIVGPVLSGSVLFRFGFKSGYRSGEQMGLNLVGEQAMDFLGDAWMEMGFARPILIKREGERIRVVLGETLEAPITRGKCEFTRGFLDGLVSSIFGVAYECEETACNSRDGGECHFILRERSDRRGPGA